MDGLTIVEEYISKKEEKELIDFIDSQEWSNALSRRTQHYGYEYNYRAQARHKNPVLEKTFPIPEKFLKYIKDIDERFNQVIVNEYQPGQGISPHIDHVRLFGDTIASISLGSAVMFKFEKKKEEEPVFVYLQPRTLIIMEGDARWRWLHSIPAKKTDEVNGKIIKRERRISLTFRIVV